MNTAHTPGPWKAEADEDDPFGAFEIVDGNDNYIVRVSNPYDDADLAKAFEAELAANAKLIAAAPELLEVAQRSLAMVSEGAGPPNWDWIREVIAKATA